MRDDHGFDRSELAIGAGPTGAIHQEAFRYAVGLPLARYVALSYDVFGSQPAAARRALGRELADPELAGEATFASFENDIDVLLVALPEALIVAIPGTKSRENWGVNLDVELVPVEGYDGAVRVHAGFKRAWDAARASVIRFLTGALAERERKIYLAGHSLGGAIATIAAADLSNLPDGGIGPRVAACYTFGAPKVGTRAFDSYVRAPLYRVTQGVDVVPALPFGFSIPLLMSLPTYRQGGDTRWFPPAASGIVLPERRAPGFARAFSRAFVLTLFRSWWTGRLDLVADHAMDGYVARLRAAKAEIDGRRREIAAP